jgi:hypothetical protein
MLFSSVQVPKLKLRNTSKEREFLIIIVTQILIVIKMVSQLFNGEKVRG